MANGGQPRHARAERSKLTKSITKPSDVSSFGGVDQHSATRLYDQRAVQAHAERLRQQPTISKKQRLLEEIAFYPKHAKRTETLQYKRVHHEMVVEKNLPCLVCGVRFKTLKNVAHNPYGAKQMETHHCIIEWALANAVDVGKFNQILRPNLAHRHGDVAEYQSDMTKQQILDWVDHSPHNLWVLCDVHHRAKYFGIHEITYPIWCPMDLLEADFDDYVKAELKAAAKTSRTKTKKKTDATKSKERKKFGLRPKR